MDEDQEDLFQGTDDESLSENEDNCLPVDKPEENYCDNVTYYNHSKLEFLTAKFILILSTFSLLILLPIYQDAINVRGSAYSLILTNMFFSMIVFVLMMLIAKYCFNKYKHIRLFCVPLKVWKLVQVSVMYFLCIFIIIYSLDRKRVLCHLQDPMKGVVLAFALLYYFFFCKKLMGLQRIFSTTTIIVGLFIAVDYGLCDEFRCRGMEREKIVDDTGSWSWQTHDIWTAIYIVGLAAFAGYFTLLDRYMLSNNEMEFHTISFPRTFLYTVSSSVSAPNTGSNVQLVGPSSNESSSRLAKKHSIVHVAMWIHVIGFILTCVFMFIEFIPEVGKGSTSAEVWNYTLSGISCHFMKPDPPSSTHSHCGNVSLFSWFFLLAYVIYVIMSIKFLVLSQSAVYTLATMSVALPLVEIWWSLFHIVPNTNGLLEWSPVLTGELICALLGLPVIAIGLFLLCKAHFKDYHSSRFGLFNGRGENIS